jgi:hypothetical protein
MPRHALLALVLLGAAAGCSKSAPPQITAAVALPAAAPMATTHSSSPAPGWISNANAATPESGRRVIRAADLTLDDDAPEIVSARLTGLAESKGGFVVSSETSSAKDGSGVETQIATVVFRVPSGAFDEALAAARSLGKRVANEKVTGQDVTEEYVDVEARIKSQRAIEEQYLSVLKDARSITDILAVEQKLGEVRTEIERAEGRRRFLESQTSFSTLTVHVMRHVEAIDTSGPGFGRSLREAGHDAMEVSVGIVNGAIRLAGVLLPIGVLLGAPAWLIARLWMQRRRRLVRPAVG